MSRILKKLEKVLKWPIYSIVTVFLSKKDQQLPLDGNSMQRILLVRDDRIGDMVVSLPLIQFIKDTFPHLKIDILCSKSNYGILKDNLNIYQKYILPKSKIKRVFYLRSLKKNNYDCIIPLVFLKKSRYGFFSQIIQTKNTTSVVFETSNKEPYSKIFSVMSSIPYGNFTMTEVILRWFCLLFNVSFKDQYLSLPISIPNENKTVAETYLKNHSLEGTLVVYNVSASESIRQLEIQTHIEFLDLILQKYPTFSIIILYIEKDIETIVELKRHFGNSLYFFEPTNELFDTIALLEKATFVVSPNTAITHVTASLDIPLLSIQSYLSTPEWKPKHSKYRLVTAKEKGNVSNIQANELMSAFSSLINDYTQQ